MLSKLLIPIDGSDNSLRALEYAIFLSKKTGAHVTALHVMENLPFVHVQSERALNDLVTKYQNEAKKILDNSKEIGNRNEVDVETTLLKGDASSSIIDFSRKGNFDTIIMGRRGMGRLKQIVLGSTSNKVLSQSDSTVIVVK